jgi:hypothetical protein
VYITMPIIEIKSFMDFLDSSFISTHGTTLLDRFLFFFFLSKLQVA